MSPYFYVYRPGTAGPKVKHDTVAQAVAEAERLAAKHPGLTFEILQILAITSTPKVHTFWIDGITPPHP